MIFENPANAFRVEAQRAPLWTLLFGSIYFAYKGLWGWALLGLLIAIATFGLSWLVFPFFANRLIRNHYLSRGWNDVSMVRVAAR